MAATNQEIVTFAFWKTGIIDETQVPSAVQAATALVLLNDFLADQAADGMNLGWYPQSNLANTAPLRDADIHGVKCMLARIVASHYGVALQDQIAVTEMLEAERRLVKRYNPYFESDLGELQRAQGGPWGGPNWI